jgi:hypothetical protein
MVLLYSITYIKTAVHNLSTTISFAIIFLLSNFLHFLCFYVCDYVPANSEL